MSIGDTGISFGCHCHLEIKLNGVLIDPEPYVFGEMNPESGFADVPDGYPHADNIRRAAELGIMGGVSATEFRPLDPASRGSIATVSMRLYDLLVGEIEDGR
jgi:murein DD-endopeptidase MepM/ murein hydrolase activator NlpD